MVGEVNSHVGREHSGIGIDQRDLWGIVSDHSFHDAQESAAAALAKGLDDRLNQALARRSGGEDKAAPA